MAAKGPSQRKNRISSLVYSTLGANLGIGLPTEEKEVFLEPGEVAVAENSTKGVVHVEKELVLTPPPQSQKVKGRVTSDSHILDELKEAEGESNKLGSLSMASQKLDRLYSSPASSSAFSKRQARLAFTSKSGAGSLSSSEQATLSKQSSISENGEGLESPRPLSPVSKQLKDQISLKNSIEPNSR